METYPYPKEGGFALFIKVKKEKSDSGKRDFYSWFRKKDVRWNKGGNKTVFPQKGSW